MISRTGHETRMRTVLAGLTATLLATAAHAGPVADYERALAGAYAPYRAALMQTNQKDKPGTEASLAKFEMAWGQLMAKYRSAPPPQYADDPKWAETIAGIEAIIVKAKAEANKGDLAAAHDTLEAVRERLGELRARNGVVTFSDRMDAYHHHMEVVLIGKYEGAEGIGRLREGAAVLAHLAGLVEQHAPAGLATDGAFKEMLTALTGSAKALLEAARSGDREAITAAMKALKPAYARMFVRYG